MMATSAPLWMSLRVCPADPLALSHPQANHSQSQGCRGEVPVESQHLIGDGLTDWMTEEVDFSSYLPNPHYSPSPTSSLPPSPLQNDIQVPSDLEVMTSLLQEELAQLEDYFLSEPLPDKGVKSGKCDKGPVPVGPQSYYQLPYASYTTSNQSEPSPLLVTLATGELDLLSFCGGPIGRTKIPRHAPYNCSRSNGCGRRRSPEGVKVGEVYENSIWSSKGNHSGNSAATHGGPYSCVEDERGLGKSCYLGSSVETRRCTTLPPKEEKNGRFTDEALGDGKGGGFGFGRPLTVHNKKEELGMFGVREVNEGAGNSEMDVLGDINSNEELAKANALWKNESSEGCYLQTPLQSEPYPFLGTINEQVKAQNLQMGRRHDFHCGFLEDQGSECLSAGRESLDLGSPSHKQVPGIKEDPCPVKYELEAIPMVHHGERKQKKRDQNKTAAHRYRQRKRVELDSLEDQLHGLEGRNRELRDKAESVEREIQYVKDLLIEVYKARSQRLKQETNVEKLEFRK
ncbi:uncharacterized protein atf5a [Aplochiton taeniatus]